MELRDYQQDTIDRLYQWFTEHEGNPCAVLPTGAGKSVIIASFCKRAISDYPGTVILMLTHQKELIEQDYAKLTAVWPEADAGIYSAGIGRKELGHTVTFASIQSIWRHAEEVGTVHLVLVDEAHLINHEATGMYRTFIEKLREANPKLRVVGFTATPYRLKGGRITEGEAIFSEPIIEPVSIETLQKEGFLCRLSSKITEEKVEAKGVDIVAGDYNRKQLEKAVDIQGTNEHVVAEVISRCQDRKSWLFFCAGVSHAQHIKEILVSDGISAECVTGETPKAEREAILERFKAGEIRALTNANVLTTGFDAPNIDLIVMLRPTKSPGLYVQMAGRGLRTAPGKTDCLVLDFVGNVMEHGPVTDVVEPRHEKKTDEETVAPCKVCPECGEIIRSWMNVCPVCGYEYPKKERKEQDDFTLHHEDINAKRPFSTPTLVEVSGWKWSLETSKAGNRMVKIQYLPSDFTMPTVSEYMTLEGNGWTVGKNLQALNEYIRKGTNNMFMFSPDVDSITEKKTSAASAVVNPPVGIVAHKEGKYLHVDTVGFDTADGLRWWDSRTGQWRDSTWMARL